MEITTGIKIKDPSSLFIMFSLLTLSGCTVMGKSAPSEVSKLEGVYQIIIAILVLVIAVLLFRFRIQRIANRKELYQKNVLLKSLKDMEKQLLKEKEWLIKEVHHRVKNNLQMVTSLLYSQSVYQEDDLAKSALKDSLCRMQAMSMIHQRLYEDQNISTLSISGYITDLVHYLHESFETENRIVFEHHVDDLELDVSQAIPLGLILTEGIVNAIKYAFPSGQKGIINITITEKYPGNIEMNISDNGNGFMIAHNKLERGSLGFELMHGLAKQLGGNIEIENGNGVSITVDFDIVLNK